MHTYMQYQFSNTYADRGIVLVPSRPTIISVKGL